MPSGKRDQFFREMNERAEKGILSERSISLDNSNATSSPKDLKKEQSPEAELINKKMKKTEPNENFVKK